MSEPAYVGELQRESLRQLAAHRKVNSIAVGGLQRVVICPQVGLGGKVGHLRETPRRRRDQELHAILVHRGDGVDPGNARQVLGARDTKGAAGILQGCGQTGCTDLVGSIQEGESRPVINAAEAGAEHRLVVLAEDTPQQTTTRTRRIGDGDSRREIRLFKDVKARAAVYRTPEGKCNRWLRRIP